MRQYHCNDSDEARCLFIYSNSTFDQKGYTHHRYWFLPRAYDLIKTAMLLRGILIVTSNELDDGFITIVTMNRPSDNKDASEPDAQNFVWLPGTDDRIPNNSIWF